MKDKALRDRPLLPVAERWTVDLPAAGVSVPPVSDGERIFVAYRSKEVAALSTADGQELWRQPKEVAVPLALGEGLLFLSGAETVEALHVSDGTSAWVVPRVKAVAPLVADGGWVLALTDTDVVAIRSADGAVIWRRAAGGVRLPPAIDGDRVYLGANDGRVAALALTSGEPVWERYLPQGVTAIAASRGRVYAGAGDKQFYCLNGRTSEVSWPWRIGALVTGRIAFDEDRVYFAALDNVVRALDRNSGNQRWQHPLRERPTAGVATLGNVVFVPSASSTLAMIYAKDGRASGSVTLPGDMPLDVPPAIQPFHDGLSVAIVTSGLSNAWHLTFVAPDYGLPLAAFTELPGVMFLSDPILETPAKGIWRLFAGDPPLVPLEESGFPVVLRDPPLERFTVLPGLQLRPLSPILPIRRGGSGPDD